MKNREVARNLYEMAELLELKAENKFKIIAYQKAARAVEGLKKILKLSAAEENWNPYLASAKQLLRKLRSTCRQVRYRLIKNC